ncbi:MAG: hypothetical protein ACTSRS_09065 [Candidatus Helarchaeota archaeon]
MPKLIGKERVLKELKESIAHKIALRRRAPLIGLIFFSITLWGAKLFTWLSPGTTIEFYIDSIPIHFHHFMYGIIILPIGIIFTFFEGTWFVRAGHFLFGCGLGFIVDEIWLLLTFDATEYFTPRSQQISMWIGVGMTIIYAIIAFGSYISLRRERKVWEKLYEAIESGSITIDF